MSIYIYRKTHNTTGLKYIGKFKPNKCWVNVYSYPGSGTYWKRHLKKHGNDVTTEILGVFNTEESASEFALNLSESLNIVVSSEYANLKPEDGLNGGSNSCIYTPEVRKKMSDAKKRLVKEKGGAYLTRHLNTPETIAKMRKPKGTLPPKKKCPHCDKEYRPNWYQRHIREYHDNI